MGDHNFNITSILTNTDNLRVGLPNYSFVAKNLSNERIRMGFIAFLLRILSELNPGVLILITH